MTQCLCMVQQGQISAAAEAALRTGLSAFAQDAFGSPAEINWIVVPERSGFSAGEPSAASIVSLGAHEPLEQPRRAALLKELCDLWINTTGCSINDVVGVIRDPETS